MSEESKVQIHSIDELIEGVGHEADQRVREEGKKNACPHLENDMCMNPDPQETCQRGLCPAIETPMGALARSAKRLSRKYRGDCYQENHGSCNGRNPPRGALESLDRITMRVGQPDLSARLEAATEELIQAREKFYNKTEIEILAREALKAAEVQLILRGEILGKNEKEREAHIRNKTVVVRQELADAESKTRNAKFWLETCQDRLRLVRSLLECEKLEHSRDELTYAQGIE